MEMTIPHQAALLLTVLALSTHLHPGTAYRDTSLSPRHKLHHDLFHNYTKGPRPIYGDEERPTEIHMTFGLNTFVNIDEKHQTMITAGVLYMQWYDESLSWNPDDYANASSLVVIQDDVWVPDINVFNSLTRIEQLGHDRGPILVESSGVFTWQPIDVFETPCAFDITYFPFDIQNCTLNFGTTVSVSSDVKIVEMDPETILYLANFIPSNQWQLIRTDRLVLAPPWDLSRASISFTLRRRPTKVVCNIVIPVLLLSLTTILIFLLPIDGERMSTVVTILLAYAVYLTIVADSMPKNALYISLLEQYLLLLIGLATMIAMANVVVLRMSQKRGHCGPGLARFLRRTTSFLCLDCANRTPRDVYRVQDVDQDPANGSPAKDEDEDKPWIRQQLTSPNESHMTWNKAAKIIDRLCFIGLSLATILISSIFYAILYQGPKMPERNIEAKDAHAAV